jgi:DNA-binding MarR family transcriptional regulator
VNEGHELGMLLRKAYLLFHRRANGWLLKHGLTADQFVILAVVAGEPGIMQITIGERTASDPNSITVALRLLEKRGLIRRQVHARDGRARCVFLTAEGRRILRRAESKAEPLLGALLNCMADNDRPRVEAFLERVQEVFARPFEVVNDKPATRTARPKAKRRVG